MSLLPFVPTGYAGFQNGHAPPKDYPWGREVNFIDLAGVCWHVGEGL